MSVLKKIGGVAAIVCSLLILLMFLVSFYNIIFKGGKYVFDGTNRIIILVFIPIMFYLFFWGIMLILGKDSKSPKIKLW